MLQLRSILDVADNTGARKAALIQRMGQQTFYAHVGDIVTVHIKESTSDATVKKGEVAKAVVVRTKAPVRRADGSYLRFDSNAIVIIDATNNSARSPANCARRTS
jgi:large subunit ribosomal protein L14